MKKKYLETAATELFNLLRSVAAAAGVVSLIAIVPTSPCAAASSLISQPSVAAVRQETQAYPAFYLLGARAGSITGGGLFVYAPDDTASRDNGGTILVDAKGRRYHRADSRSSGLSSEWFGAYGDAVERGDCSIKAASSAVTCIGYVFTAADIGKTLGFLRAGSTITGGPNNTLIGKIKNVSSGDAILSVAAGNSVASRGVIVFGHDDTGAINGAIRAAGSPALAVMLDGAGYLLTGPLQVGGKPTYSHAIYSSGQAKLFFLLPDFETNAVTLTGAEVPTNIQVGQQFAPIHFEGITINCMDTGLDCLRIEQDDTLVVARTTIRNSFRNCVALAPGANGGGNSWQENLHLSDVTAENCGHHAFYAALLGNRSHFSNDSHYDKLEARGWGLNSARILAAIRGGPPAPWFSWSGAQRAKFDTQLGAGFYFISTQTGGFNGFTCTNCTFDSEAGAAQAFGSQVNPHARVFADGKIGHLTEGPGNPNANNLVRGFSWNQTRTESVGGAGTKPYGFSAFAEDEAAARGIVGFDDHFPDGDASFRNGSNFETAGGFRSDNFAAPGNLQQSLWSGNVEAGGGVRCLGKAPHWSGSGLECQWNGAGSVLNSIDRGSSSYRPLELNSSAIEINVGRGSTNAISSDASGNVTGATGSLPRGAKEGFFYLPAMSGRPSGVPTAKTGYAPVVVDSKDNEICFWAGAAWRCVPGS